jgi:hypothetical protein
MVPEKRSSRGIVPFCAQSLSYKDCRREAKAETLILKKYSKEKEEKRMLKEELRLSLDQLE